MRCVSSAEELPVVSRKATGSIPVRTAMTCSSRWPRMPLSHGGNTGSNPVHVTMARSFSGLGQRFFTSSTRVRLPYAPPTIRTGSRTGKGLDDHAVAQPGRASVCTEGHSFKSCLYVSRRLVAVSDRTGACSSFGRAPALQAGGSRFDPGLVHLERGVCRTGEATAFQAEVLGSSPRRRSFARVPHHGVRAFDQGSISVPEESRPRAPFLWVRS